MQRIEHPDLDVAKIQAEIAKLMAETAKLNAEAAKMTRERAWFPAIAIATAIGAAVALLKLLS